MKFRNGAASKLCCARNTLLLAAVCLFLGCTESQTKQRPNILLIVVDDMGYTDLGSFGGEISTPNLDLLALRGRRLTNFHTAPSCAPTRAMLLTGTDNHLAGMGSQSGLATPVQSQSAAYQNAISLRVPTIAERIHALGYRAVVSAKWHVGSKPDYLPNARGFDRSFVLLEGGGGHFDETPLFEAYGKANWLEDDRPVALPEDFYSSDYMTDKILEYIKETPAEQPYFAYLGYTAPHWPLQAPTESLEKYRGKYNEGWDVLRATRMQGVKGAGLVAPDSEAVNFEAGMVPWDSLAAEDKRAQSARMTAYAAMIDRLDENIGRLLQELAQRGDLDNTVIFFMSDNGAEAHRMELYRNNPTWLPLHFDNAVQNIGTRRSYTTLGPGWAHATAAPFRASKSKISEGGIRVPAFVSIPGSEAGIDSSYMRVMDLAPTFLDLADPKNQVATSSKVPDEHKETQMMGRSLLSRWLGGPAAYSDNEFVAAETYNRRMVQRGDWKALLQQPPYGTGEWQLYNLARDPGEQLDLSAEYPELRAELIAGYNSYAEKVGVIEPETSIRY